MNERKGALRYEVDEGTSVSGEIESVVIEKQSVFLLRRSLKVSYPSCDERDWVVLQQNKIRNGFLDHC